MSVPMSISEISFPDLQSVFLLPVNDAARSLGVCTEKLHEVTLKNGIPRWPYRKLTCLSKAIEACQIQRNDLRGKLDKREDELVAIVARIYEIRSLGDAEERIRGLFPTINNWENFWVWNQARTNCLQLGYQFTLIYDHPEQEVNNQTYP